MNMEKSIPDYKKIYTDIITKKFPNKKEECLPILNKQNLSAIDIINLNNKIFGHTNKETNVINHKLRSYSKTDILQILDYKKKHKLNNSQLANHFKLSKNTVTKWKKLFVS